MDIGVGIELQNNRASIAVIGRKSNELILRCFETIEAEDVVELKEKLKKIFTAKRMYSPYIALSVPIQNAILRKFSVEFTDPQQIDQIIYYETENYIHSHEIEQLLIDYYILRTEENRTKLSVAAVTRENIERQLHFVEDCNIYPFILDIDIFSLFYLSQTIPNYQQKNLILIHAQDNFCNFLLVTNGKVHDVRSLLMRTSWFAESMMTQEMNSTTEIRIDTLQDNLNIDIPKYYQKLHKELQPLFLKAKSIDNIYISGNDSLAKELTISFQNSNLPCSLWNLHNIQKADTIPVEKKSHSYIPIGLALRSLGIPEGGFNFRKGDFAYKNALDVTRLPLGILFALLFLLLIVANIYHIYKVGIKKREYEHIYKNSKIIYERNFHPLSLKRIYTITDIKKKIEQHIEKHNALPQLYEMQHIWSDIAEAIHKVRQKYYITIDEVSMEQNEITFEGRTDEDVCLDVLKNYLKTKDWVEKEGQKVLESIRTKNAKNPELHTRYKYFIKLKVKEKS